MPIEIREKPDVSVAHESFLNLVAAVDNILFGAVHAHRKTDELFANPVFLESTDQNKLDAENMRRFVTGVLDSYNVIFPPIQPDP